MSKEKDIKKLEEEIETLKGLVKGLIERFDKLETLKIGKLQIVNNTKARANSLPELKKREELQVSREKGEESEKSEEVEEGEKPEEAKKEKELILEILKKRTIFNKEYKVDYFETSNNEIYNDIIKREEHKDLKKMIENEIENKKYSLLEKVLKEINELDKEENQNINSLEKELNEKKDKKEEIDSLEKQLEEAIKKNQETNERKFILLKSLSEIHSNFGGHQYIADEYNEELYKIKDKIIENSKAELEGEQKDSILTKMSTTMTDLMNNLKITYNYNDEDKNEKAEKITNVILEIIKGYYDEKDNEIRKKVKEIIKEKDINKAVEKFKEIIKIKTIEDSKNLVKKINNNEEICKIVVEEMKDVNIKNKEIGINENIQKLETAYNVVKLRHEIRAEKTDIEKIDREIVRGENIFKRWKRQMYELKEKIKLLKENGESFGNILKLAIFGGIKTFFGGRLKKNYSKNVNFNQFVNYKYRINHNDKGMKLAEKKSFNVKKFKGELDSYEKEVLKTLEMENSHEKKASKTLETEKDILSRLKMNNGRLNLIKFMVADVVKKHKSENLTNDEIKEKVAEKVNEKFGNRGTNKEENMKAIRNILDASSGLDEYITNKAARAIGREMLSIEASIKALGEEEEKRKKIKTI